MCFDSHLNSCVVAIAVFCSVIVIVILIFVIMFPITTVNFSITVTTNFVAIIFVVNDILMFSVLVLLCLSYFTVNIVDK